MPPYLPIAQIRLMRYEQLERWRETDFNTLAATAVAEATGKVHDTVKEALQSEDWIEQWSDALYASLGELMSSLERMSYTQDRRLQRIEKQTHLIQERNAQVRNLLRSQISKQGWDMAPQVIKDARLSALALLANHHIHEMADLKQAEIFRRGLPEKDPFADFSPRNRFDAIENAVSMRTLQAPLTPSVQVLLDAPDHILEQKVAQDARNQQDRCDELRHPLLLRQWCVHLKKLRDQHCILAGISPTFSISLPRLEIEDLLPNNDEAWKIINRRRFIRALSQRHREYSMYIRQTVRTAASRQQEVTQPWHDAVSVAREELAKRHPQQLQALLIAFRPFCEEESTAFREEVVRKNGNTILEAKRLLKRSLQDRTWKELLDND